MSSTPGGDHVALDRQMIEKRDFPIARRGYEPTAVDAHLSEIAVQVDSRLSALTRELEQLKRSDRGKQTLASSSSELVRSIVAAAESSAAEIRRKADDDAGRARELAESESQATHERAAQEARELLGKVSESTAAMLERISSMELELSSMTASVRAGCERLAADLERLRGDGGELAGLAAPSTRGHSIARDDAAAVSEPQPASEAEAEVEPQVQPEPVAMSRDEADGARLIALNMALNGNPRGKTARYLSENFSLLNADQLLDDIYARIDDQ